MNCHYIAIFIALAFGLFTNSSKAAAPNPAKITPNLNPRYTAQEQPFSGEMRFLRTPALAATCSIKVVLASHRQISEPAVFRIVKTDVYNMPFGPDSAVWEAPIDSGATKTFYFTFKPELVGCHRFAFAYRPGKTWAQLATLQFDINEDGKTICAGPSDSCKNTPVPPHPLRTGVPLVVEFPVNELERTRTQDRHFSAIFKFTPGKAMVDSIIVEFELECHVGLYSAVQFQVESSNNISVSKLPASWGDKAGPASGYQYYRGRMSLLPLRAGLTLFDFKIIGKHPSAQGDGRLVTDFPIHLVIGENGEILFAGQFDPYTRFKEATDPMLGSLQQLLAVGNRDFRTRIALSLPDYRGEEIDARDNTDTTQADTTSKSN